MQLSKGFIDFSKGVCIINVVRHNIIMDMENEEINHKIN